MITVEVFSLGTISFRDVLVIIALPNWEDTQAGAGYPNGIKPSLIRGSSTIRSGYGLLHNQLMSDEGTIIKRALH